MSINPLRASRGFADQIAAVRGLLPGMDQMSLAGDWAESRETVSLVLLAILVGVLCGFAAFTFAWLINRLTEIFFPFALLGSPGPLVRDGIIVLAPALGGLIVGPLIAVFAREAKGHGVPSVMRALIERGGIIHPNIAVVKTIASAVTLGSGGSAGREGPIVQIGASLGSAVGQVFRVRESQLRTLVICGASGGIAAIFNAPFAGVFYGTEVLLEEFEARAISVIVLTAVTASIVIRALQGNQPAFAVPFYTLVSAWELGPYVVLGILSGLVSVLFIIALYTAEDFFHVMPLPGWVKPALGGLAIGLIGLLYPTTLLPYPAIFSSTYVPIGVAVAGKLGLGVMIALLLGKLIATSLTLGSGGSGGVFGPSLFLGAMLGGAFGIIVNALLPGVTAPPGAYALVGMAAVLGAAGHAPITGIMLAFEMVDNYQMILPLMLTTVVAYLITRFLLSESIDTLALARAGISYRTPKAPPSAPGLLQRTPVGAVMTRDVQTVPPAMPLDDLAQTFNESGHHGFPVVDGNDRLLGIVALSDLEHAILQKASGNPAESGTGA
ncbi:MAG TPA: chloride channel protein, partial [Chloroflexota bacterium]|nr:chloride channel protein [Chloroflexota bacterium]